MSIEQVDAYLVSHRGTFEEQLKALIRIPSVSAQPDHAGDVRLAAEFVRDDLQRMDVPAELIETPGQSARGNSFPLGKLGETCDNRIRCESNALREFYA